MFFLKDELQKRANEDDTLKLKTPQIKIRVHFSKYFNGNSKLGHLITLSSLLMKHQVSLCYSRQCEGV